MSTHALTLIFAVVIWIIQAIVSAVAKANKNRGINTSIAQRTPPMPPPVQQPPPVPQQFSAPVQSSPQYAPPQRPIPQYVPPAQPQYVPQQQEKAPLPQQYGAYAPTAPVFGQRSDDPFGLYSQSRQDPIPTYNHPDYSSQAQPPPPQTRIQSARSTRASKASVDIDTATTPEPAAKTSLSGLFTSKNAIIRAVILQEVLGPPKSKR